MNDTNDPCQSWVADFCNWRAELDLDSWTQKIWTIVLALRLEGVTSQPELKFPSPGAEVSLTPDLG